VTYATDFEGSRAQQTEDGSHASDNVHLAGVESSPTDHIVQLFCMKMTFPKENDFDWMPGLFTVAFLQILLFKYWHHRGNLCGCSLPDCITLTVLYGYIVLGESH